MPHISYLKNAIQNRKETIRTAVNRLNKLKREGGLEFEAIAFTGLSGSLIAPAIADILGVGLIAVRKADDESTHSDYGVETASENVDYIIVDDVVGSGRTVKHIQAAIERSMPDSICQGIYLYAQREEQYAERDKIEELCPVLNAVDSNVP